MGISIRRGNGNASKDLGFAPDAAANLQLRSDRMIQLRKRLTVLGATQWAIIMPKLLWIMGNHAND